MAKQLFQAICRLCCNLFPLLLHFFIAYPDSCQSAAHVILNKGDDSPNSNAPVFKDSSYNFYVQENLPPLLTIGGLSATDGDTLQSGDVSYEIDATMSDGRLFSIATYTGELMTRRSLDREQAELLKFVVIARDRGTPSRSVRVPVEVRVLDMNDNSPQFNRNVYVFQIVENQSPDALVGVLKAIDNDIGRNSRLSFAIVQPNFRQLPFNLVLGSEAGLVEIRTSARIDREKDAFFEFTVKARDQGSPTLTTECVVRISIGDLNDNNPHWIYPRGVSTSINVSRSLAVGQPILRALAVDQDAPDRFGDVRYSILQDGGSVGALFNIDAKDGSLSTNRRLGNTRGRHQLILVATDCPRCDGVHRRSATATLSVNVVD